MAQHELYTVAQAAQALSLSKAALRAYASKEVYRRYLSTEATPAPGKERRFTADDIRLFRFIADHTALGESHESVAERLAAGELETFTWEPVAPQRVIEHGEPSAAQLVPYERLQAAQALLQDAQRRETEAKEQAQSQIQALQDEVRRLTLDLGQAQGELSAYKRRRPQWWIRLFGE